MSRFWVRMGDANHYEDFDGPQEAAEAIREMTGKVYGPDLFFGGSPCTRVVLPGFEGQNYVSAFWGDGEAQLQHGMSQEDEITIRRVLVA